MNVFDKIADFARQLGAAYFDDEPTWGTDAEWKAFLDSGRRPGDGFLPPPPPPPRPVFLPSLRNHGKRLSGSSNGPLVLVGAASEVSGAGHLPAGRPDFVRRGIFGTLFGPPARLVSGGPALGSQRDRAWLSGGPAHGRRK